MVREMLKLNQETKSLKHHKLKSKHTTNSVTLDLRREFINRNIPKKSASAAVGRWE
jgi:hypothetical protein